MTYEELRAKIDELRAFPLKEIEISEEERTERLKDYRNTFGIGLSVICFLPIANVLSRLLRDKPIDLFDKVIVPIVFSTCFIVLYYQIKKKYVSATVDRMSVEYDSIVIESGIHSERRPFKKILVVKPLDDGLLIKCGRSDIAIDGRFFGDHADRLKFKDALVEISKGFKGK